MDYPIIKREYDRIRTLLYDETGRRPYHRADKAGCTIFKIAKEVIKLGGADKIFPLGDIASAVLTHVSHHS